MQNAVIVSAVRTPIGAIGGTLKNIQPEALLSTALKGAIERSGIDANTIDEVICGQAKQCTDQPNIARVSSLSIGLPESIPAYSVHRQCASGMQAILNGVQQIQTGYSDIVLCGGVESMSTAPFYIRGARFGVGNGNTEFVDPNTESQPCSQPSEIYGRFNMIETADEIARRYGISREACDEFALSSQKKAIRAIDEGKFEDEIVPVFVPQRKSDPIAFSTDEYPKRNTDLGKMSKLKPIFKEGVTTAGNASGRNDGAAALMLVSEATASRLGLHPLVRIVAGCARGVDPRVMGLGPVEATNRLKERFLDPLAINMDDIGLIELNEAFAAQSLGCIKLLRWEDRLDSINVNGGAIALGHPLGCSGARISVTLIHEMIKRKVKYGLATICVAGGLGMSMLFERL